MDSSFLEEDTLIIKRVISGGYDTNGVWQNEVRNTLSIKGCIQPIRMYAIDRAGNKRLQQKGSLIVYSKEELQIATSETSADIIVYIGKEYEVVDKSWWEGVTMSFWKYNCEILDNV